jgi:hypothetical protein
MTPADQHLLEFQDYDVLKTPQLGTNDGTHISEVPGPYNGPVGDVQFGVGRDR